jgi:hypothetical protein
MEQTECSETSAHKIQTSGNYPEENIQLLNMFRAPQRPSSGARQTAVAASGFRMNVPVEVFSAVVGLMMGIVMPETC